MSGTSMDGIDVALLETDGERVEHFGARATLPYAPDLRAALGVLVGDASRAEHDPAADLVGALTDAPTVAVDRTSVVQGKSVSVRVDLGGRRSIKKYNTQTHIPKLQKPLQLNKN